jgi:hypothetical protein
MQNAPVGAFPREHEGTTTMRNIWLNIDTTTGRHDFGAKHSNPNWIQLQLTRDDYTNHRDTILSTFKPSALTACLSV